MNYNSDSEKRSNSLSIDESESNENRQNAFEQQHSARTKAKSKIKRIGKFTKKTSQVKRQKYDQRKRDNIRQNVGNFTQESSSQIYKNTKEHFLYMPFYSLPDLSNYVGSLIEVRIASEFLSQSNKAFLDRRIWGSDSYTSDSDMVCILQHSGYFDIKELPPTNISGISLFLRVSKCRTNYNSSFKNGIKSKKIVNFQGHSVKPENFLALESLGEKVELVEMASKMPRISEFVRRKPVPMKLSSTFYLREFNMRFNLSCEMWLAYSLPAICDKSKETKDFTSRILRDKVLYLETAEKRYEICSQGGDFNTEENLFEEFEKYCVSEVKDPTCIDNEFMMKNKVPLEKELKELLLDNLDWHDFIWGEKCVKIKDLIINGLKCFNFYVRNEDEKNN